MPAAGSLGVQNQGRGRWRCDEARVGMGWGRVLRDKFHKGVIWSQYIQQSWRSAHLVRGWVLGALLPRAVKLHTEEGLPLCPAIRTTFLRLLRHLPRQLLCKKEQGRHLPGALPGPAYRCHSELQASAEGNHHADLLLHWRCENHVHTWGIVCTGFQSIW